MQSMVVDSDATVGVEPAGERDAALDAELLAAGASPDDVAAARAGGWLPLLALDRRLMPGRARYDLDGVADAAGVDPSSARVIWRALGFPDVPDGVAAFSDTDATMLAALFRRDAATHDEAIDLVRLAEQVRVVSGALARVASLEADELAVGLEGAVARGASVDDPAVVRGVVEALDYTGVAMLVDYVHRIQLRAALWRRLADPSHVGATIDTAVGFADIAGYTAIAQQADEADLAALLSDFEAIVHDTVAKHGGRVIKTIGDGVMYSAVPVVAADIALDLASRTDRLPPLCQGVACGSVLDRDGDLFGPVVNLASRLTDIARPSTVLVSDTIHDALVPVGRFDFRLLRSRNLRGIGTVSAWVLRPGSR